MNDIETMSLSELGTLLEKHDAEVEAFIADKRAQRLAITKAISKRLGRGRTPRPATKQVDSGSVSG